MGPVVSPLQIGASKATGGYKSEGSTAGTLSGTTSTIMSRQAEVPLHPRERTRMVASPEKKGSQFIVPLRVICRVIGFSNIED